MAQLFNYEFAKYFVVMMVYTAIVVIDLSWFVFILTQLVECVVKAAKSLFDRTQSKRIHR